MRSKSKYTRAGRHAHKRGLLDIIEIVLLHRNGRLSTRDAKLELRRFLVGTMSDSLGATESGVTDASRTWATERTAELSAIMCSRPVDEWPGMLHQIADRLGVAWVAGGPRVRREITCVACGRALTMWSPVIGEPGADPMPDGAIVCPMCDEAARDRGAQ